MSCLAFIGLGNLMILFIKLMLNNFVAFLFLSVLPLEIM